MSQQESSGSEKSFFTFIFFVIHNTGNGIKQLSRKIINSIWLGYCAFNVFNSLVNSGID